MEKVSRIQFRKRSIKPAGDSRIPYFLFLFLAAALFGACAKKPPEPRTVYALGTVCAINLYEDGSEEIYDEMAAKLNSIEETFSVNIASSEISLINRNAGFAPVPVSPDALYLIKMARYFAEKSGGAFDPTIGPLSVLWAINTDDARVPLQEEIDARLPLVDYRKLVIDEDGQTVFLPEAGMMLDLGGIAKGFAADCLVEIAHERGVNRAVIDLGGNIYVLGARKDGAKWKIGVKDPENPEGEPAVRLETEENSIVTSGMYERFFEEGGRRYHHILDPKTGYPAESGVLSATIVSASSLVADALSTAVFILGREEGLALLEAGFPEIGVQAEGMVIGSDHRVSATTGLASCVTVMVEGYR
jgi:thiamine biosynthesis lipoprotein